MTRGSLMIEELHLLLALFAGVCDDRQTVAGRASTAAVVGVAEERVLEIVR